jgi:hypothetical protein
MMRFLIVVVSFLSLSYCAFLFMGKGIIESAESIDLAIAKVVSTASQDDKKKRIEVRILTPRSTDKKGLGWSVGSGKKSFIVPQENMRSNAAKAKQLYVVFPLLHQQNKGSFHYDRLTKHLGALCIIDGSNKTECIRTYIDDGSDYLDEMINQTI